MATHTPGPWITAGYSSIVGAPVVAASGRTVAKVAHTYIPDMPQEYIDECVMNGHLIAAAPDLFSALRDILQLLRNEAPGTPLNNRQFNDLGIRAYAAIAKAKGETR